MKKAYLTVTVFFLMIGTVAFAGSDQPAEDFLPIGLTDDEMSRLDEIGKNHRNTRAPAGQVRNPAEWEPSEGVIIRWPLGISVSLVAEMSEGLMVTTIVASSLEENDASSAYTSGGVNMVNTQFLIAPTNSIWTRDYGPWFVFEDEQLAIVDHIYNRPRPYDDVIPQVIGSEWGFDVYGMDLVHTGGNHMSDGFGMSMSTGLVYSENPGKTPSEVDSIMLAYLGNNYTVLDYVEHGGIHHIDCWAKFLNPTTILVKDAPVGSYSHNLLNERADYLSQQLSPWDRPYTVVRIYCPYGTAYTNSIILNGKVLVPMFGDGFDSIAIETYQDAMPGYEILGFTGSFYDHDAIHCRTMGVPDRDMLFIHHVPLTGLAGDPDTDYLIAAAIADYSLSGLIAESLKICYSVDDGPWEHVPLAAAAQPDSFYGYIPGQPAGSDISYYLEAADSSGRVETHPYIGQLWAHAFTVTGLRAPSEPFLVCPACDSGLPLLDMLPVFVWTESYDPDPLDTVRYRLELSLDSGFTSVVTFDSLMTPAYQTLDSLEFGTRYWWQVTAYDRTGLSSASETCDFWTWTLGDIDHTHGVDIADLQLLIDNQFISLAPIDPPRLGDVNGDCTIDVGDVQRMVDHLFISMDDLEIGCEAP